MPLGCGEGINALMLGSLLGAVATHTKIADQRIIRHLAMLIVWFYVTNFCNSGLFRCDSCCGPDDFHHNLLVLELIRASLEQGKVREYTVSMIEDNHCCTVH